MSVTRSISPAIQSIGQDIADLLDSESAAALRGAAELNGIKLRYASWVERGNTAATLISAYATRIDKDRERKLVLKISRKGRSESLEPLAHRKALAASSPTFRDQHLVELPWDAVPLPSGGWIMFKQIASGSLNEMRPLSTILDDPTGMDGASHACATVIGLYTI